jgi:hypothetical protein
VELDTGQKLLWEISRHTYILSIISSNNGMVLTIEVDSGEGRTHLTNAFVIALCLGVLVQFVLYIYIATCISFLSLSRKSEYSSLFMLDKHNVLANISTLKDSVPLGG